MEKMSRVIQTLHGRKQFVSPVKKKENMNPVRSPWHKNFLKNFYAQTKTG